MFEVLPMDFKEEVAKSLGVLPEEIVFTSGGTEADNLALFGTAKKMRRRGKKILSSDSEHPAVEKCLAELEKEGFEKNVVVLTQPREYKKSRSSILPLIALRYGRKSGLYRAMARRAEGYNAEKEYVFLREGEKAAFVIAPERPLPASRTEKDPAVLDQTHRIGYETAKALFPALQEFLAEDQSSSEV